MENNTHNLDLGLRWLTHELANGLLVLRTGVDVGESELIEGATSQLIGLVRCVQLIMAQAATRTPDNWKESLYNVASAREVEIEFHCDTLSIKQAQVLACLFLALIPKIVSGTIILIADNTKTEILASGISDKAAEMIITCLNEGGALEPHQVPFYLAKNLATDIKIAKTENTLQLEVIF